MNSSDRDDLSEIVIIVPDFSAFDVSDFLVALYGGPVPPDTSAFEQIVRMFDISMMKSNKNNVDKDSAASDVGRVFGQLCSEIEKEFFPPPAVQRVLEHAPR
jgi:hypothetical protein